MCDETRREDIEIALNDCKNQLLQRLYNEGLLLDSIGENALTNMKNTWFVTYARPTTFLEKGQAARNPSKTKEYRVIIGKTSDLTST